MGEPDTKRTKLDATDPSNHWYPVDNGLKSLVEWVVEAGGYISPAIELYKDQSLGYSARGASRSAAPDSNGSEDTTDAITLISCPSTRIFSLVNPEPDLPAAFIGSPSISQHAKACFHLCQHILLGERSPFWPYISLLPHLFNTPLYFSDSEMERLAGTNLGAGDVASRAKIWKDEWEAGLETLRKDIPAKDIDRYSWDLYLRAATIYTSRSFPSKLALYSATVAQKTLTANQAESFPVLIPLVDILNHKPNTKIIWEPTSDLFSLKSMKLPPIGAPVFNNYGPKANEELLMGYGFVIPDNPVDSLAMKFTVTPRGPAGDIWGKRQSKQKWAEVFHLSKSVRSERQENGLYNPLEKDWPDALVDLFRILVANEYEVQLLQDTDPNLAPVSTRNELAVAIGLRAAMAQKLSTLRKFDNSAVMPPTNERERSVDIYRRGQEDIMITKVQNLDDFIKNYALDKRLSSAQYIAVHSDLALHMDKHPIPSEEYTDEDGNSVRTKIIDKGELIILVALLREYFARDSEPDNTSEGKEFWDAFVSLLMETPGLVFGEFQQDVVSDEMEEEDEEQQIYSIMASYCNAIPAFYRKTITAAHISWAWGIVRMKSIEIPEAHIVLTI